MTNIFPIDFEEKLTMAQDDYILFSDSEDGNKIKKAQYKNLKWEKGDPWTPWQDWEDGTAATITVWSTTTWAAGSSASVTNSGTSSAAVLDFTIPQWAKWEPWEDGQDWADGAAATITVWTTTTLPAWSSATVTNVWTSQDAILNFWIPKWDSWTWSWDVNWPASSTDWHLAVFDWATWKIIKDWGAIPEWNVKSFTLSSTSDLVNAQAVYDWWVAGNNPIIIYQNMWYLVYWYVSGSQLVFRGIEYLFSNGNSASSLLHKVIYISIDNWIVDWITIDTTWSYNLLSTTANYSTPYTPTYDGSPTTKKYVDDKQSTITVTLAAASWSSQSITVSATWVTASNTVIVAPDPTSIADYTSWWVYCSAQWSWTLTFACDTEPTNDIDVNVVILN